MNQHDAHEWFHLHEGWYFRRTRKGGAQMGRGTSPHDVEVEVECDGVGWASVIAHLASPAFSVSERYVMALNLHLPENHFGD